MTITLPAGYASATKVYDNKGFLVTPMARALVEDSTTLATRVANKAQASASGPSAATSSGAAGSLQAGVVAAVGVLAGAMIL